MYRDFTPRSLIAVSSIAFILLVNLYMYTADTFSRYEILPHIYYAIIIVVAVYSNSAGAYLTLGIASAANLAFTIFFFQGPEMIVTTAIFPFISLFIIKLVKLLKDEQQRSNQSFKQTEEVNAELSKKVIELSTLFEISKNSTLTLDLGDLFHQAMEVLSKNMKMYRGTLSLWDNKLNELTIHAAHSLTKTEMEKGRYKLGEGIVGKVMQSGQPIAVPSIGREPLFLDKTGARSQINKDEVAFLCVPVKVEGETVGVLSVDKTASDVFSLEDDLRTLTIVASIIGQTVKINQMISSMLQSEKLATLGKIATSVAHEVRNPLGGIKGAAQLLQLELSADSESQEYAQIIVKEVNRLNRVIEQLLSFGKTGKTYELKTSSLNLNDLLRNCLKLFDIELKSNEISLQEMPSENLPSFVGDPDQLFQLFLNLIKNAIEAMPESGELIIKTEVVSRNDSEFICVEISDTGIGIADETKSKLFDPFYTTKPKGTGLGLAISRRIIEEHNGIIEIRSNESGGAVFCVLLPI